LPVLPIPPVPPVPPIVALGIILAVAVGLMLTNRIRPDVVAIGVALALGITGIVKPDEVFAGLGSSAVITITGIFILAQGLERTGVTRALGRFLARINRGGERGMIALVMSLGAFLSLFMNNIAAAVVLLPGVADAVKRRHLAPSKIMMPLAFATALGGTATLLTTGNIVVSGALTVSGLRGYGLLDFWRVGLPLTLAGMVYMLTIGRRLLPVHDPHVRASDANALETGRALAESYELRQRLNRVTIPASSTLVDKPISGSGIGQELGLSVLAVVRNGKTILAPVPGEVIRAGDTLLLIGRHERAELLRSRGAIVEAADNAAGDLTSVISDDVALVEVMIAPRSRIAGQTLKDVRFREKFGATVLAIWHGGRSVRTDLATLPLQSGDSLLVHGWHESIPLIRSDADFLVLHGASDIEAPIRTGKALFALIILAVTLIVGALGMLPIALAMMLGALVMVLSGCLTMDEAYRAVEWRAVFLIAGMLPVSIAMAHTGAAGALGHGIVKSLAGYGPVTVGAGLLVLTMLLAQVMSGQVVAVVLAPIAIAAAQAVGSDPRAMAMFVALGSSLTFLTPTAHPVNAFVMGVGGYTAGDYLKAGIGLTLISAMLAILLVAYVWKP